MTINPLRTRPPVEIPDRPTLTKAQKAAIWSRENGLCPLCLKPVAPEGLSVQYDHRIPRELLGEAADDLANIFAVHTDCHAPKTALQDIPRIAKAKRQSRLCAPKVKKAGGLSHPKLKRKMDGSVVPR